jgi:transposase
MFGRRGPDDKHGGAERMTDATIGIDVSKARLHVHRLPDGAQRTFTNDRLGLENLIEWLGGLGIGRVVFEPTGWYHRGLEDALAAADVPACKVNPRQDRRFAEATDKLAKTDRVDARLLARFGVALEPAPVAATGENLLQLRELVLARRALIRDRTAINKREKGLTLDLLKRQNAQRLRQIETQLAAIKASIQEDEALSRRHKILLCIPGISAVTAATLVVEMPELGTLDARQVASLAGLAPITRQSGTWQGRAFIRGGRAQIRRALYMPALVAARFNPDLKTTLDRLTSVGNPPKIAITAVMRKLLILANALLREERKWRPTAA